MQELSWEIHVGNHLMVFKVRYGEGNGTPLQYSCLESSMDRGAWQVTVHGVTKSQTGLSDFTFTFTFMPWRRKWQPTPVFLPGEFRGRESLAGYRPWGGKESDTTAETQQQQQSQVGEGNGTPLQYSCLENPMDGGAWQVAVHGVTKSQTRLSDFTFTFHFHALEKEMATHSSVLARRIPGTREPGGLQTMGWQRVGHD